MSSIDSEKRGQVIKELLDVEISYNAKLRAAYEGVEIPMRARIGTSHQVATLEEVRSVFSALNIIYHLLNELQETVGGDITDTTRVTHIYRDLTSWLKVYAEYIRNYTTSAKPALARFGDQTPGAAFARFISECESKFASHGCPPMAFASLLAAPVQQLPRYKLLLSELMKVTPASHEDMVDLEYTLIQIEKACDVLNEQQRASENQSKLAAIAKLFKPEDLTADPFQMKVDLIQPTRKFIAEARCRESNSSGMPWNDIQAFLFNDIIVSGWSSPGSKLLSCRTVTYLTGMKVSSAGSNQMKIERQDGQFYLLQFFSPSDQTMWESGSSYIAQREEMKKAALASTVTMSNVSEVGAAPTIMDAPYTVLFEGGETASLTIIVGNRGVKVDRAVLVMSPEISQIIPRSCTKKRFEEIPGGIDGLVSVCRVCTALANANTPVIPREQYVRCLVTAEYFGHQLALGVITSQIENSLSRDFVPLFLEQCNEFPVIYQRIETAFPSVWERLSSVINLHLETLTPQLLSAPLSLVLSVLQHARVLTVIQWTLFNKWLAYGRPEGAQFRLMKAEDASLIIKTLGAVVPTELAFPLTMLASSLGLSDIEVAPVLNRLSDNLHLLTQPQMSKLASLSPSHLSYLIVPPARDTSRPESVSFGQADGKYRLLCEAHPHLDEEWRTRLWGAIMISQCSLETCKAIGNDERTPASLKVDALRAVMEQMEVAMKALSKKEQSRLNPLGCEDGRIPNSAMVASDNFQPYDDRTYESFHARLNRHRGPGDKHAGMQYIVGCQVVTSQVVCSLVDLNTSQQLTTAIGAWCSKDKSPSDAQKNWLRVDLGRTCLVGAVATQGRNDEKYKQWVKQVKIAYSIDGTTFKPVENEQRIFMANWDSETPVKHMFAEPVKARFIKFIPVKCHEHTSMRVEVYGVDL